MEWLKDLYNSLKRFVTVDTIPKITIDARSRATLNKCYHTLEATKDAESILFALQYRLIASRYYDGMDDGHEYWFRQQYQDYVLCNLDNIRPHIIEQCQAVFDFIATPPREPAVGSYAMYKNNQRASAAATAKMIAESEAFRANLIKRLLFDQNIDYNMTKSKDDSELPTYITAAKLLKERKSSLSNKDPPKYGLSYYSTNEDIIEWVHQYINDE